MSIALGHQVLVLNRLWQAVNLCSVRRALALLFEETDNPDYMSAANDAEALLEFIEGIVDEAVV